MFELVSCRFFCYPYVLYFIFHLAIKLITLSACMRILSSVSPCGALNFNLGFPLEIEALFWSRKVSGVHSARRLPQIAVLNSRSPIGIGHLQRIQIFFDSGIILEESDIFNDDLRFSVSRSSCSSIVLSGLHLGRLRLVVNWHFLHPCLLASIPTDQVIVSYILPRIQSALACTIRSCFGVSKPLQLKPTRPFFFALIPLLVSILSINSSIFGSHRSREFVRFAFSSGWLALVRWLAWQRVTHAAFVLSISRPCVVGVHDCWRVLWLIYFIFYVTHEHQDRLITRFSVTRARRLKRGFVYIRTLSWNGLPCWVILEAGLRLRSSLFILKFLL